MFKRVYPWTFRATRVLVAALVTSAITVFPARHASASAMKVDNCSTEQSIFVQDVNPRTGSHDVSYGTMANVYIRFRDTDKTCMQNAGTWSMVNISDKSGSQAEIGYKEWTTANLGISFNVFACWQTLSGESCTPITGGPAANANNWMAFKVANYPVGSSNFETWYDNLDGNGWHDFGGGAEPFMSGYSEGETSRIGDLTGMLDHHRYLQYKISNSNWADWNNQMQDYTTVDNSDYYYHWMSSSEYEICQNGGTCPWQ